MQGNTSGIYFRGDNEFLLQAFIYIDVETLYLNTQIPKPKNTYVNILVQDGTLKWNKFSKKLSEKLLQNFGPENAEEK